MKALLFRLRFRLHLWWCVPGLGLDEALAYGCDVGTFSLAGFANPVAAAEAEATYMREA